jgi:hypothetical protein
MRMKVLRMRRKKTRQNVWKIDGGVVVEYLFGRDGQKKEVRKKERMNWKK